MSGEPFLCSFLAVFDRLILLLDLEGLMRNRIGQLGWAAGCLVAAAVWMTSPAAANAATAAQSVQLYVDGEQSALAVSTIKGSPYVPLDTVVSLGGAMKADADGETYTISSGRKEVRFTVGEKQRYVDGVPQTELEAASTIGSKVLVPLAWVADTLNVKFVNDKFTSSVYVFHKLAGASTVMSPALNTADQHISTPPSISNVVSPSQPSNTPVTVSDAPPTFTGITIEGDALRIDATGELTPTVFHLKAPERIVIDLPGATLERAADGSASGSVSVDANHPYISGIRYSLFAVEPSTVRIVVDLKKSKTYRMKAGANGTGATIHFADRKPIQVMIDAGHGGHDPGAISITSKYEKDVTLSVAEKVNERLAKESLIEPILVRDDDTYTSPAERAAAANAQGVDLFVSIHANTASSPGVKGTETYYWRENSLAFAQTVHKELLNAIGSADRKVKQAKFAVVRETTMPAALLELGFLTNSDDEAKLFNEQIQDRIADAIVTAIKTYYSIP
jgi:N-acetylmuramoyl-L-alanine amidase